MKELGVLKGWVRLDPGQDQILKIWVRARQGIQAPLYHQKLGVEVLGLVHRVTQNAIMQMHARWRGNGPIRRPKFILNFHVRRAHLLLCLASNFALIPPFHYYNLSYKSENPIELKLIIESTSQILRIEITLKQKFKTKT